MPAKRNNIVGVIVNARGLGVDEVVGERVLCPSYDDMAQFAFTTLQGQYLAFIATYTKLNGLAPAEADMQRYFRVTAPSVHQMVVTLERRGLISRQPGKARSIQILVPREQLPALD